MWDSVRALHYSLVFTLLFTERARSAQNMSNMHTHNMLTRSFVLSLSVSLVADRFNSPGQYCLLACINTSTVPDESVLCGGMTTLLFLFVLLGLLSCINSNINKSNTHTSTALKRFSPSPSLSLNHTACSAQRVFLNSTPQCSGIDWPANEQMENTRNLWYVYYISWSERFARNGFALLSTHSGFEYNIALFRFCCSRQVLRK